ADAVGLSYDEAAGMPDADVYARLFPGRGQHESVYAQPDWSEVLDCVKLFRQENTISSSSPVGCR
ncbi:hypothetical protein, partial [Brevibacterium sp. FAM 24630]|uniref:hypothetical protein n=1 Tax=Brevibacterium sp. FAM 24630 TaxID=3415680 RepID=UPI003C7B73F5